MKYRAAVASTDGIVINQHFGHAEKFHIVEFDTEKNQVFFLESRDVPRVCQGHEHSEQGFEKALEILHDVQAILVAKIGQGASAWLESRGLTIYEAPFMIEPVLQKILDEKLWEVDSWQFPTKN